MLPPTCVQEVLQHTLNICPPCFAFLQGFSVRTQLHSISLHTVDKDLREFVVRSGANQSQWSALTIPPPLPQLAPPTHVLPLLGGRTRWRRCRSEATSQMMSCRAWPS